MTSLFSSRDLWGTLQRAEAAATLTAGIVHDVRNALHLVLAHAELLEASGLQPEQLQSVRAIALAGGHANAVLRDLLTLAHGPESTTTVVVNAAQLVEQRRLLIQQAGRQIDCAFELDPGTWPIVVEPHQLESALINLVANAREAMPQGGRLFVSVRNARRGTPLPADLPPGDYVSCSVRDTGAGMTPQVLARATEAFFTTKAARGGTGLGLAMVQAFAARAGGALRIDSAPGRGTEVDILLPRAAAPSDQPDGGVPTARRAAVKRIGREIHVAWVRDVLKAWEAACHGRDLPRLLDVEAALLERADSSLVVLVTPGPGPTPVLRLHRMGRALATALADVATGTTAPDSSLFVGALGDIYRRVAASGVPSYEHLRYVGPDQRTVDFERLVLPAASGDRGIVSHVIGAVALPGHQTPETGPAAGP